MLGEGDPRSSMGYVIVGLFSHTLLRELFEIEDTDGKEVRSQEAIDSAIRFLEAASIWSDEEGAPPQEQPEVEARDLDFRSYEAVATLYEALEQVPQPSRTPRQVACVLKELLQSEPSKRLLLTRQAIEFARALGRRAAVNARFPRDEIPAGVRELARQQPSS